MNTRPILSTVVTSLLLVVIVPDVNADLTGDTVSSVLLAPQTATTGNLWEIDPGTGQGIQVPSSATVGAGPEFSQILTFGPGTTTVELDLTAPDRIVLTVSADNVIAAALTTGASISIADIDTNIEEVSILSNPFGIIVTLNPDNSIAIQLPVDSAIPVGSHTVLELDLRFEGEPPPVTSTLIGDSIGSFLDFASGGGFNGWSIWDGVFTTDPLAAIVSSGREYETSNGDTTFWANLTADRITFTIDPTQALPGGAFTPLTLSFTDIDAYVLGATITESDYVNASVDLTDSSVEINIPQQAIGTGQNRIRVTLDLLDGVAIITQPASSIVVNGGSDFEISVEAIAGVGDPSYTWMHDGQVLMNDGRISGADSPVLAVANTSTADTGIYTCIVSGGAVSDTTTPTIVAVRPGLGGATGACCLPLGDCAVTTETDCLAESGIYQGDSAVCGDASCPVPNLGDLDGDNDVDLADYQLLQGVFTGPM